MKQKQIFRDPGFWILLGINVYLVYYYYQTPRIFTTLIWLYWCQSVLIGLFNILDILTVRTIKVMADKSDSSNSSLFGSRVKLAVFFMLHYGFFHLVYLVFVATLKPRYPVNWAMFKYFLFAFLAGQIFTFVQHKIQQRKSASNMGVMFFVPYLRIIPMHLTILIPAFCHISNLGIFLILKAIADVIMYIVTKPSQNSRESNEALVATQSTMNI